MSFFLVFTGLHVSSKLICSSADFRALKTRQRVVAKPDHAQLSEPFFFGVETWRYSDCAHLSILRNTKKHITRHLGVINLTSDATIGWCFILHLFALPPPPPPTPPPHTHTSAQVRASRQVSIASISKLNALVRPSPRLSLPRGAPHSRERGASIATKNLFAAGCLTAAYSRAGD